MTNERLTDERLKYADDDFDAYFANKSETQKLVRELVAEVRRLRDLEAVADADSLARGYIASEVEVERLRGALEVIAGRNTAEGAAAREALGEGK